MADGRTHSKWFCIILPFFIGLLILLKLYSYIPLLILANSIINPDEDQKWMDGKPHRSFFTHSILWSLTIGGAIILALKPNTEDILITFGVISVPLITHLFLDLFSRNENGKYRFFRMYDHRCGKYRISFYPFKGHLSANRTIIWLLINILIIVLYWVYMVWSLWIP